MRSSWEVKYAMYLDNRRIQWQYEPKTFDLGDCTYTPDFYLPKTDEYIEVKGRWFPGAMHKIELFIKKYPNLKLRLLNRENLQILGIKHLHIGKIL